MEVLVASAFLVVCKGRVSAAKPFYSSVYFMNKAVLLKSVQCFSSRSLRHFRHRESAPLLLAGWSGDDGTCFVVAVVGGVCPPPP